MSVVPIRPQQPSHDPISGFINAALANFHREEGSAPSGVVIALVDSAGAPAVSFTGTTALTLAFLGAYLNTAAIKCAEGEE